MGTNSATGIDSAGRGGAARAAIRRWIVAATAILLAGGAVLGPAGATFAANTAVISGVIRAPDGVLAPDGPVVAHIVTGGVTVNQSVTVDPATGAFSFTGLPANAYYYLWFTYSGTSNIVTGVAWDGTPTGSSSHGATFSLSEGETREFEARLLAGAVIEGHVAGVYSMLESATIVANRGQALLSYNGVFDSSDGSYRIDRLAPGTYRVTMSSTAEWEYVQWNVSGGSGFTLLEIAEGQVVQSVDAVLPRKTTISGRVQLNTNGSLSPLSAYVTASPVSGGVPEVLNSRPPWTVATPCQGFQQARTGCVLRPPLRASPRALARNWSSEA